jgi:hypothetical protein
MDGHWLMQHEFLLLICNSGSRVDVIDQNCEPDFFDYRQEVPFYEINVCSSEKLVANLHLLSPTAFENRAPHKVATLAQSVKDRELIKSLAPINRVKPVFEKAILNKVTRVKAEQQKRYSVGPLRTDKVLNDVQEQPGVY